MKRAYPRFYATLLFVLSASPLCAKLANITFEEFLQQAPCALVVQVDGVNTHEEDVYTLGPEEGFDISCELRVLESFSRDRLPENCRQVIGTGSDLVVWFSTESHSSVPQKGEVAIVFPKKKNGILQEAVYGRSYWRLVKWPANLNLDTMEWETTWNIEITWRNDFLTWPVLVASGERALLPLSAVKREWEGPRTKRKPK
jgi:hypothetical protein